MANRVENPFAAYVCADCSWDENTEYLPGNQQTHALVERFSKSKRKEGLIPPSVYFVLCYLAYRLFTWGK
jgi:hypothetical protein